MATKILNVKGLDHAQKEKTIFPAINALQEGEALKIIVEFNPVPLHYMLAVSGEFSLSYEKEGPDEWILNITRIKPGDDRKRLLRELIRELKNKNITEETKEKAKKVLESIDPATLGLLEQELIREGISHEDLRKSLCDIHLELFGEALISKRKEVPPPHPVNTFMEEHKIILKTLGELSCLVEGMKNKNSFNELGVEVMEKLKDVTHHLVEAESHHHREEEVLFPKLEKYNVLEPPKIMKMEHDEFRSRKQELYKVVHNFEDFTFEEFREKFITLGSYLSRELKNHIFKEDNILYQIALQLLSEEDWEEVKSECDKIGYCCFTPQNQRP